MSAPPLAQLVVVDLTQDRAGAYATRLMAGFGARVIKVEPPDGDRLRSCGPYIADKPGRERGVPFHWLNGGKQSVVLDIADARGRESLAMLLRRADVLIEDLAPGELARRGFDQPALDRINPRLVVTSISNFGQDGPRRDYVADETVMYAMSGGMVATGDADKPPLAPGPAVTQYTAGLHAYIGTLMALLRRGPAGSGERVDVSIQESALDNVEIHLAEYAEAGKVARRKGDEHPLVPWRTYPCRDGYVAIIGGPMRHWHRAAALFEEPRLAAPDLAHMGDRVGRRREVEALFAPWLQRTDKKDVYHKGQAIGLAFGYVATLAEALGSPQHSAREFFRETEPHPDVGRLKVCGPPFRFGDAAWIVGRAPRLGEHTETVLKEVLQSGAPAAAAAKSATERAKGQPLAGIRIIDLCHEWAGPHAGRLMADFGAEVIKVEYFRRLDHMRGARKQNKMYDKHARYLQLNRNKRSVTLDLREEPDRSVYAELVARSDVVLSNMRPGVLERLGFGYDALKAIKPDIILVALSACGQTGPEASYCGYGAGLEATSGVQSLTAYSRDSEPRRIREMDVTNGIMGAAGIMTALAHRQRTGQGSWVDLSEVESPAHSLGGEHFLEYACNGRSTRPLGNRHPERAPHGCYRCQGDDAWLAISVATRAQWEALCTTVGHREWIDDPRFATPQSRHRHHDELDELLTQWTAAQSKLGAMERLQAAGVPAGAVMDAADLHADLHLAARGYFRKPGQMPEAPIYSGFPFRLSGGGGEVLRPGPPLGEGNRDVVCGLLGRPESDARVLTADEIHTDFDLPDRSY